MSAEARDAYASGWDEGREALLSEIVCSVCGYNHDRDESAACEGCEPVELGEWIAAVGAERAAGVSGAD